MPSRQSRRALEREAPARIGSIDWSETMPLGMSTAAVHLSAPGCSAPSKQRASLGLRADTCIRKLVSQDWFAGVWFTNAGRFRGLIRPRLRRLGGGRASGTRPASTTTTMGAASGMGGFASPGGLVQSQLLSSSQSKIRISKRMSRLRRERRRGRCAATWARIAAFSSARRAFRAARWAFNALLAARFFSLRSSTRRSVFGRDHAILQGVGRWA